MPSSHNVLLSLRPHKSFYGHAFCPFARSVRSNGVIANGRFDPNLSYHWGTFNRSVRTICELKPAEKYEQGIYNVMRSVLNTGEVNKRYTFKLNRAHWNWAWRICRHFVAATTGKTEEFVDAVAPAVLTPERIAEIQ